MTPRFRRWTRVTGSRLPLIRSPFRRVSISPVNIVGTRRTQPSFVMSSIVLLMMRAMRKLGCWFSFRNGSRVSRSDWTTPTGRSIRFLRTRLFSVRRWRRKRMKPARRSSRRLAWWRRVRVIKFGRILLRIKLILMMKIIRFIWRPPRLRRFIVPFWLMSLFVVSKPRGSLLVRGESPVRARGRPFSDWVSRTSMRRSNVRVSPRRGPLIWRTKKVRSTVRRWWGETRPRNRFFPLKVRQPLSGFVRTCSPLAKLASVKLSTAVK